MVDFQSRDTRRGRADDEDPPADDDETTADENETTADGDVGDQPATATGEQAEGSSVPAGRLGVGLVTITSNGSAEDDPAGAAVFAAFEATDLAVATREVIEPGYDKVQSTVSSLAKRDDVDLVVTAGATEAGPDDVTPEAVRPLLDRDLPGFGELFRLFAHDEVGSDVLTMRPVAGVLDGTPVFCLPGEAWAARLGASEIVVPQAARVVEQARDADDAAE